MYAKQLDGQKRLCGSVDPSVPRSIKTKPQPTVASCGWCPARSPWRATKGGHVRLLSPSLGSERQNRRLSWAEMRQLSSNTSHLEIFLARARPDDSQQSP